MTDEMKIISENCIEIEEGTFLFKADRPGNVMMLFGCRAGAACAVHITTLKLPGCSMEIIRSLFCDDPYYRDMLKKAIASL